MFEYFLRLLLNYYCILLAADNGYGSALVSLAPNTLTAFSRFTYTAAPSRFAVHCNQLAIGNSFEGSPYVLFLAEPDTAQLQL